MLTRFVEMPSALRAASRVERLGPSRVPVMLVHPNWDSGEAVPVVLWTHGRTAHKEIDPGRYLRWMRSGIGACAIDLPGHGERYDENLQQPENTLTVVRQMIDEFDEIVESVGNHGAFDMNRVGIGGMSAGGMATMARLCSPHPYKCAAVEASSGSWEHQRSREMFRDHAAELERLNPIKHLDTWREIPFLAIHTRKDEWIDFNGQQAFIEALRSRYTDPDMIEFVVYEETGAPYEHAGFGRMAADAKDKQRDFFGHHLLKRAH